MRLFHKHDWIFVSNDDSGSWAGNTVTPDEYEIMFKKKATSLEDLNIRACYGANMKCSKCGADGFWDAGSRMMGWHDHIYEVKRK